LSYTLKKIYFTVTNDLVYDQRMNRICTTLAATGYSVTLVGRKLKTSLPLAERPFTQKRLNCFFTKGKLFYTEYTIHLFFFLLFKKPDAVCAIDLDTILPCLFISKIKKCKRIYDAHELFTEMKEVITRPAVKKMWLCIEKYAVPKFKLGYTVSESIADEFAKRYNIQYETIRNVPVMKEMSNAATTKEKYIIYTGAVNEARAFEQLIPAMKMVTGKLVICGDGNFMPQLKQLIKENNVAEKIELKGMLPPDELWRVTQRAAIGIAVAEKEGLNQYLALPNKFFDYIHAGLPQVSMNYPEYKKINTKYNIAILIDDLNPETIAGALNNLLSNDVIYNSLKENCLKARSNLNWQEEEKKLIDFYKLVFNN
jgi:glycosyltransferase involved in cell wall biosynthesis